MPPVKKPVTGPVPLEQRRLQEARKALQAAEQAMARAKIERCSHCNHEGPAERDFGLVTQNGLLKAYSWCRTCRGSKCSHPDGKRKGDPVLVDVGKRCEHGRVRLAKGWR